MRIGEIVLAGIAVLILFVTVLPFSRNEIWWVRGWDFPRLQIAVLALVTAVAAGVCFDASRAWSWIALLTSFACFAYQTSRILPYSRLFRCEVKRAGVSTRERRLRILSSNVLISNREYERLLVLVREHQPDILVTLESDARWQEQLDRIEGEYPHTIKHPLANGYGMHVYSRLPLEDARVEFLVEAEVPSMHASIVLPCGQRVRAHFLHPAPPSPTENERSTERDAELVIVAKRVARESGPVVVTGDLNDVAWSATTCLFRKLSRLLDPRIGRGAFNTFHAGWFFIRWPLDHIFHSREFTLVDLQRLSAIGSDHFPILVDLALEPENAANAEAPRADESDQELAQEKVARAAESAG